MSLLIKALNKAEEKAQAQTAKIEQAQDALESAVQNKPKATAVKKKPVEDVSIDKASETGLELSLSPTSSTLVDPASVADTAPQKIDISPALSEKSSQYKPIATTASAKSAANVFSSKGMDARNQNKPLAIIAGLSLLALLGMGFYYYQFANQPAVMVPAKPANFEPQQPLSKAPLETTQTQLDADTLKAEQATEILINDVEPNDQPQAIITSQAEIKKPVNKTMQNLALAENEALEDSVSQNEVIEEAPQVTVNRASEKTKKRITNMAIASESASIQVTKSNSQAGINPDLMSAYEAYNAGKDAEAQQLYKQVLQRDMRNVDALLGLGAIATKQGRIADANDWYNKVLEIEPSNSIAQSALLDNQRQIIGTQDNAQDAESRIKNMLAKQPEDANLYMALGNLYAEQNQWPAAQQAYFDAFRLNANADNALNLAVSLDHMGKPKLALPYYQRALALAASSRNIDKAALEARIAAIQ